MRNITFAAWLFVLAAAIPSQATPLTWHFIGATFADGTPITGSFQFDDDVASGTTLSWAISVQTSTTFPADFPAFTYNPTTSTVNPGTGDEIIQFTNNGATRQLLLSFVSPLTDAGGTVAINIFDSNALEQSLSHAPDTRLISAGAVTTTPEPGSMIIAGSALLAIGFAGVRRRRKG